MNNIRENTLKIKLGNTYIGGSNKVLIQSMCNIKTSNVKDVVDQINRATKAGADIMRVSVLDMDDAKAIGEIKKNTSTILVADIHFDYRLALECIAQGIDKIRINPGNIGSIDKIKAVTDACKEKHIPIRIGVNSGSIDKEVSKDGKVNAEILVESARKHVAILESLGFYDIVISLKGSNVIETIEAYELASKMFKYPLHLGITEAGPKDIGVIRSSAGLSPLLLKGIGNTIRISLSDDPVEEIIACKRLLHDLGLYPNYPTLISCPTCGRTQVDVIPLSKKILTFLEENNIYLTVAIMGCVVNGPGEAKNADIGVAGGKGQWVIFKKGQIVETVLNEDIYNKLTSEILKMIK